MRAFIITDYCPVPGRHQATGPVGLAEGKLKYAESVVEGFEKHAKRFIGLFTGGEPGQTAREGR